MSALRLAIAFVIALLLPLAAAAQHADVKPNVADGRIVTDGWIDATSELVPGLRVFGYDFQEDPVDPYVINDPGFNTVGASSLPPSSQVGFTILDASQFDLPGNLSYWNGSGPVVFGSVPSGETLRLNKGTQNTLVDSHTGAVTGFTIGTTAANGSLHQHTNSFLQGSDGNVDPNDGIVPAAGIYLVPFNVTSSDPSISASRSLFLVYNNGLSEARLDAATDWVEMNLLFNVTTWKVDANGNWPLPTNWTAGVPNAADDRAIFGSAITQPRTVTVNAPMMVGRINFDNANAYTIAGDSAITLDANNGDAQIKVTNGSHTISAPLTLPDNTLITVTPAASNLSITRPLVTSSMNLTKAGAGTLTLSNVHARALAITDGTVAIAPSGGAGDASVLNSLSIAGDATPTARLDLDNNAMVVDYTGTSPAATIRQQIVAGRGGSGLGKPWNGPGITSSTARADVVTSPNSRSVGYAVNADLPLGAKDTFRGQPVDPTTVLIRYTRTADANLDGIVNDDDVTVVGTFYAPGVPKPEWAKGDFDYNGFVDDDDVTLLGVFYNPAATPLVAPLDASVSAVTAVPEPATATLTIFGLLACGTRYLCCRRRQMSA